MSYRIADKVNGTIGGLFATETEAKAFIEEEIAEGMENEINWLMELAHSTQEGGAVNMEDDGYVRRILSAAESDRRKVARECARERMIADYTVVLSAEK